VEKRLMFDVTTIGRLYEIVVTYILKMD